MARLTSNRFASAQTFDQVGRNLPKGLAILGIRRHERDRRSGRHEVAGRVRDHCSLARKRVTVAQLFSGWALRADAASFSQMAASKIEYRFRLDLYPSQDSVLQSYQVE